MTKRALITGITGQDGSYLAEFLLSQGYEVFGLVRRTSTVTFSRIHHIQDQITLISGDMLDQTSLMSALEQSEAEEVYNLAAQSFVQTSWQQPVFTGDVTALGVTRLLDAIRKVNPDIRYYQASSSEMFGKVREVPQRETTPFYPRSPYGVAKVYGHWITVNYRESYGMHTTSGILFNHECVTADTPVFIRRDGALDLVPVATVVPHPATFDGQTKYTTDVQSGSGFEVWDAQGWTPVTCLTATWNGHTDQPNKRVNRIAARGAVYHVTDDHVVFTCEDGQPVEKPSRDVRIGEALALGGLPAPTGTVTMPADEAWLLGALTAAGSRDAESGAFQVAGQDPADQPDLAARWQPFAAADGALTTLWAEVLTDDGSKRVPARVLNGDADVRRAFLDGFQAVTAEATPLATASAVLAAGLYWLVWATLRERAIIELVEQADQLVYQVRLEGLDEARPQPPLPLDEVLTAQPVDYSGWVFDLATASGTFQAGVGQGWIHNSPRRGLEFVTRKVTNAVARIKLGLADTVALGNMDSRRDWGYAGDYVRAMWLMLQQDKPDDFVISTGETHSVQELVEVAFEHLDLDWREHVRQDPRFMRPAEVDLLVGDSSKAGQILGWEPNVHFKELIEMMVDADLELLQEEQK